MSFNSSKRLLTNELEDKDDNNTDASSHIFFWRRNGFT